MEINSHGKMVQDESSPEESDDSDDTETITDSESQEERVDEEC